MTTALRRLEAVDPVFGLEQAARFFLAEVMAEVMAPWAQDLGLVIEKLASNRPAGDGYRPITPIDQATHFLRPASFHVRADARVLRIGRTMTFGRVLSSSATDRRPVGMVSTAGAMLQVACNVMAGRSFA